MLLDVPDNVAVICSSVGVQRGPSSYSSRDDNRPDKLVKQADELDDMVGPSTQLVYSKLVGTDP